MRYQGLPKRESIEKPIDTGVLIVNLGTPDAPTPSALRRYLAEFLSDPRVVEFPRLLWKLVLHGIILRVRPRKSAKAYQTVWTDRGSPLLFHTRDLAERLQSELKSQTASNVQVDFAMRYGNPSVSSVLDRWQQQGLRKLIVLPMYPQYAGPTSGSTFDIIGKEFMRRRYVPEIHFFSDYHNHPKYIQALANSIRRHWQTSGKNQHLLMSYHGEPQRYVDNGDPYYDQCQHTSQLLASELSLQDDEYTVSFQSRFGREPWLQPYTDDTLIEMAKSGRVKSVDVVCPGFSADCLETIEEIGEENREYFMENGGEAFTYIPCLNAEPDHVDCIAAIVAEYL